MRTQPVEKRTDTHASFAPEAERQRWQTRRLAAAEEILDSGALALSEILVAADESSCEAAVETVLDLFGRAFEARRIVFYHTRTAGSARSRAPRRLGQGRGPALLEAVRVWTPTGGAAAAAAVEPPMPVASIAAGARRVEHGEPEAATDAQAPGWRVARTHYAVEVPGAAGPIAVFSIEGGLAAARWSERMLDRAELIGRLLGGALERTRLAADVDAARTRLAQNDRLECVGRVATAVAHDFNNVLTAIQGYTDLLDLELGDREIGAVEISEIRQASQRAAGLVDQVLRFGRRREAKVERLDLITTLRGFEGLIARVLGPGISLTIDGDANLPAVALDAGRFEPVVMNLASNARDAIGCGTKTGHFALEASTVEIAEGGRERARGEVVPGLEPGEYVRLTARDDGCGIPAAIRERVLEPWFTTKPEGEGTGLGLASLASFQRASHGAVRIESEPGEGTAIHLYFPTAPAAPATSSDEV